MTPISLLISLVTPYTLGYVVLTLLFPTNTLKQPLRLSLAYGLGLGLFSFWIFLLGASDVPLNPTNIGLPVLILAVPFLIFQLKKAKLNPIKFPQNPHNIQDTTIDWLSLLSKIYLLWIVFYVFLFALNIPIVHWDSVATIAYKGKIFYYEKSIRSLPHTPHTAYPIGIPLMQTWIALNLNQWHEQWTKIIFPFAFLSFLLIECQFLRQFVGRRWSLLGCVLTASSNLFVLHGNIEYRDFFMLYYTCVTVMVLILWQQEKKPSYLILAGLLAGCGSFIKVEGTLYAPIFLAIVIYLLKAQPRPLREKSRDFFYFLTPIGMMVAIYSIYRFVHSIQFEKKAQLELSLSSLERVPLIVKQIFLNMFFSANWNLAWLIFFFSLLAWDKRKRAAEVKLTLGAIILFWVVLIFLGTFTASFDYIGGENATDGLSRLMLHFFPLTCLAIILINAPEKSKPRPSPI